MQWKMLRYARVGSGWVIDRGCVRVWEDGPLPGVSTVALMTNKPWMGFSFTVSVHVNG